MKVLVTSCSDCPFKRVAEEVKCKLTDPQLLIMSTEPGGPNYLSEHSVHPKCPLLLERVVVILDVKSAGRVGEGVPAFLGNRVKLIDGKYGVVVAKHEDAKAAGVKPGKIAPAELAVPWYDVLLDGREVTLTSEWGISAVVKEFSEYNYNLKFPFYFGRGDGDDDR